jgi:hypothetical protein
MPHITGKKKRSESKDLNKHYNYLCRKVKRQAKRDKETFINEMCNAVENNRNQNKTREVYESIRKITGKPSPKVNTIKNKNGNLLSDTEEIIKRWKEYFEELSNDPNESDELMIDQLQSN